MLVAALHGSVAGPARSHAVQSGSLCRGGMGKLTRLMLRLDSGETLRARLLVAADGADSWLRGEAGMQTAETSYGQTAVVANFSIERPHRRHGVPVVPYRRCARALAVARRSSVHGVVSAARPGRPAAVPRRGRRSRAEVAAASRERARAAHCHFAGVGVSAALDPGKPDWWRLALRWWGTPRIISTRSPARASTSASRMRASWLRSCCAAVSSSDAGSRALLRRYERARREDILAMTAATHGLQRLFNNSVAPLAWLRNLGLDLDRPSGSRSRPCW